MHWLTLLARIGAAVMVGVAAATVAAAPVVAQPSAGLTVFAGTGVAGSAGDGGPATGAQLYDPEGIAVAADGTVYISEMFDHRIRAVAPNGNIRTVAGAGNPRPTATGRHGPAGTDLNLASPGDLAIGPDGSLYIADLGLFRILRLDRDGRLRVVAGTGVRGFTGDGGPATAAQIGFPVGLAVASDGTVYFGDAHNARVRRVAPDGTISTVAGNGGVRLDAAGGPATGTAVGIVGSLASDSAGNVWIADRASVLHRLTGDRLVTVTEPGLPASPRWGTSGATTWPPPDGPMQSVLAVAADGAAIYALTEHGLLRLGTGQRLDLVVDVGRHVFQPIAAGAGAVYFVDRGNNRVYVSHPVPPQTEPSVRPAEPAAPRWVWAAGAGIVLLLAIVLLRRRTTS